MESGNKSTPETKAVHEHVLAITCLVKNFSRPRPIKSKRESRDSGHQREQNKTCQARKYKKHKKVQYLHSDSLLDNPPPR